MNDALDVLVIGGGQAGLAMGHELGSQERNFRIVDAGAHIGDVWRHRWDSLRLFTPAQYDSLPGLEFPAAADSYPSKDDVASYLESYVLKFGLPLQLDTKVTSLAAIDGGYIAKANGREFEARQVVIATGPFQVPFVPPIASSLDAKVPQMHSIDYRNPGSLPAGRVLVVGAANTGCQISRELSATHTVELSAGKRLPTIPQRPLGRDVWWWGSGLGLTTKVTVDSRVGRRLSGRDQVIGDGPRRLAKKHGVQMRTSVTNASGRTITFADGESSSPDAVVWATGFRVDHSWIDVPGVKDETGRILQQRGVTPSRGLYVLGLQWQHTRASALLGWVGNDAAFLAERISSLSD